MPRNVRFGTSSWSFPGWAGLVYDRKATKTELARKGLAAYAKHPVLRTVGIDRTFYAPIPAQAFAEYASVVPDDFRFLVKASGECTTPFQRDPSGRPAARNDRYLDPAFAADQVVAPFHEGLGGKAGPLVFQFPPQGAKRTSDPARFAFELARFLGALPRGPMYAVELRDRELLGPDYGPALEAGGARHCLNMHPRMPPLAEQRELAGRPGEPLVVRWMLRPGLDYEEAVQRYEPFNELVDEDATTRSSLAALCLDRMRARGDVYVIANNKAEGSAPRTVFKLAERVARQFR